LQNIVKMHEKLLNSMIFCTFFKGLENKMITPFYPENNSVSTIRNRLQKVIKCMGHFKLKIRIVLSELFWKHLKIWQILKSIENIQNLPVFVKCFQKFPIIKIKWKLFPTPFFFLKFLQFPKTTFRPPIIGFP
jgi:hypothetical protein